MTATRRVCVLVNPASGGGVGCDALDVSALAASGCDVSETSRDRGADVLAAEIGGCDVLVVAGGDGTVSGAVNGLMRRDVGDRPAVLVVPLGTGNDLARTLGLPLDAVDAAALVDATGRRPLDVMRWSLGDEEDRREGYAVNVLAGGFSSKIQHELTAELKARWGRLAYARAAVAAVRDLVPHRVTLRLDGDETVTLDALNVIVANARYAGGGIDVASDADPSDGLLDIVCTEPGGTLALAELSARLLAGKTDDADLLVRHTATSVTITGDPPLPFNVDGDFVGEGTLRVTLIPAALQMVVADGADAG